MAEQWNMREVLARQQHFTTLPCLLEVARVPHRAAASILHRDGLLRGRRYYNRAALSQIAPNDRVAVLHHELLRVQDPHAGRVKALDVHGTRALARWMPHRPAQRRGH